LDLQEIQIIQVTLRDLHLLQDLSKRTFYDSFAALNTAENMQLHLDTYFTTEKLTAELQNPESKFYFAVYREIPVAYLKINQGNAQTVLPHSEAVEIERIYVDQTFKGSGIGKIFISKAVALANALRAKYLWLGVWEHNKTAIRFYERNGFEQFSKHIFKLGEDEQTDLLMRKALQQ
jgi:ribosomal protein S18 acetylase RimI-like enzyme